MTRLKQLMLSGNSLQGPIPSEINQLSSLEFLSLARNNFTGPLPFLNLTSLKTLTLTANRFTNLIPTEFGLLTSLTNLDLESNQLDSGLPTELGQLGSLQTLRLANNQLLGDISALSNLKSLIYLDISNNQFVGPIPTFLGSFVLLKTLKMNQNQFVGTIPAQLSQATAITTFALANNRLSGTLPFSLFRRNQGQAPFAMVDLHSNFLSGVIPPFTNVLNFDGSDNFFRGAFPSTLGFLPKWIKDFNQTCCCGQDCYPCSVNVCPEAIGGGTVIIGGQLNTSTVVVSNSTIVINSNVSTGTVVVNNNLTLVNSTLNVSGVISVNKDKVLVVSNSEVNATNVIVSPDGGFVVSNSSTNISVLVANGKVTINDSPAIQVGCFYTGADSSLVIDVGLELERIIIANGTLDVALIQSNIGCISGSFNSVELRSKKCVTFQLVESVHSISAVLTACAPPTYIIGIVIGSVAGALLLLIVLLLTYWKNSKAMISSLPAPLRWQWDQYYLNPVVWKSKGSGHTKVFYKELKKDTAEWARMLHLKDHSLNGKDIAIESAFAVFNPRLIQNFVNAREIKRARFESAPGLFLKQTWNKEKGPEEETRNLIKHKVSVAIANSNQTDLTKFQHTGKLEDLSGFSLSALLESKTAAPTKQWVYDRYLERIDRCEWNENESVPILATAHGTDSETGWKIAETGFANLNLLDSGYYGRGIYFTSFALYCYPYFATKRNPVLVISYVVPGNVYPVNEHHQSFNSKMGSAIESGYDSHYVTTTSSGAVPDSMNLPEEDLFDEVVIASEGAVTPVYILEVQSSSFDRLSKSFTKSFTNSKVSLDTRSTVETDFKRDTKHKLTLDDEAVILVDFSEVSEKP